MLNNSFQVPMPKEKIITRKQKDVLYVYYRTRAYRNAKGQPTNDTVLIGKKDNETGMLIPNKRYYEIYNEEPTLKKEESYVPKTILDFGNNFLLV